MTAPQAGSDLPHSAAAERNRAPILAVLRTLLAPTGRALEIASGTGQHAAHFAAALPGWHWQPTDLRDNGFDAIAARAAQADASNVAPARRLDVLDAQWPSDGPAFAESFDLVYCANLLHISPPECTPALMRGAARHLASAGLLVTYGPYLEGEVPTASSNLAFDAELRRRDARWGLRQLDEVRRHAATSGLALRARHALPANNLLLVFARAT
jgi:SAM-dependent methyltransferase